MSESLYPYPEGSPAHGDKGGFYHNLTSPQMVALTRIHEWATDSNIDMDLLGKSSLHPYLTMLRYLRANRFDTAKTIAHMMRNIEWRRTQLVDEVRLKDPDVILDMPIREYMEMIPHWQLGNDKSGRPVLYTQYKSFDASALKEKPGFDTVLQYHLWELEHNSGLCLDASHRTGKIVETVTCVVDIGGMRLSQITSDFLSLLKALSAIDQQQYPEFLGKAFVINTPMGFPAIWRIVKAFLDPDVTAKISIHANRSSWEPALLDYIGKENLSGTYGGDLRELSKDDLPYPKGYPKIEVSVKQAADDAHEEQKGEDVASRSVDVTSVPTDVAQVEGGLAEKPAAMRTSWKKSSKKQGKTYDYPPGTPGADLPNGGYFGRLNEKQKVALLTMQEWTVQTSIDLNALGQFSLRPELTLLRYLRANNFDTSKAIAHITRNIAWREVHSVNELVEQNPETILEMTMPELMGTLPHWQCGNDKSGRPVVYKQYSKFDAASLKAKPGFEKIIKYHLWELEHTMEMCLEESHARGQIIETITGVIDLDGMKMGQVTGDFMTILKELAAIDQAQYPETLGKVFIINTPSAFPFVWRLFRPFLDPAVAAKISIHASRKDWEPVLDGFIGKANMPSTYGGDLPPLTAEVHPYEKVMEKMALKSPNLIRLPSRKNVIDSTRGEDEDKTIDIGDVECDVEMSPTREKRSSTSRSHEDGMASVPVALMKYPEGTPGANTKTGGFHNNLTDVQKGALLAVQEWVVAENIDLSDLGNYTLQSSMTLLRYLRANNFDTKKAIAQMTSNIEWRKTHKVSKLVSMNPEDILGMPLSELTAILPHWQSGFDKTGRPVLYKQYANFDAAKLKANPGFEKLMQYHLWELEHTMELCVHQSHARGEIIETMTVVIDVENMRIGQVTSDFIKVLKDLANVDSAQFPETLGRVFIINTPMAFPYVWKMFRPFLDPNVAAKISIHGSRKEWEPLLTNFIGKENTPKNYGGELPALGPDVHPYVNIMNLPRETPRPRSPSRSAQEQAQSSRKLQKGVMSANENSFIHTTRRSLHLHSYKYPPGTPGADNHSGGYFGHLSAAQTQSLVKVQEWVVEKNIDVQALGKFTVHPTLTLLRYLRANNFDIKKATASMTNNIEWRRQHKVDELVKMEPEDILGMPLSQLTPILPHWQNGFDKTGRPVLYKQYGSFDAEKLKENPGYDKLMQYHLWELEHTMELCMGQTMKRGQIIETMTVVIDINGMRMGQVTSNFIAVLKDLANVDSQQYPETLGRLFIINTPSAFSFVWRMFKPFLDPNVAAKISIHASRKDWEPVLDNFIGKANLPATYGGSMPELSTDIHPYEYVLKRKREMMGSGVTGDDDDDNSDDSDEFKSLDGDAHDENGDTYINDVFTGLYRDNKKDRHRRRSVNKMMKFKTLRDNMGVSETALTEDKVHFFDNMSEDSDGMIFADAFPSESNIPYIPRILNEDADADKEIEEENKKDWIFGFKQIDSKLLQIPMEKIKRNTFLAMSLQMLCCVGTLCASSLSIDANLYEESVGEVQLWTGVIVLLLSILSLLVNIAAMIGTVNGNRPVLKMYYQTSSLGAILFFAFGISASVFVANILDDRDDDDRSRLSELKTVTAVCCLVTFAVSFIPIFWSYVLSRRLGRIQLKDVRPRQLRVLLTIAQCLALIWGACMMMYGGGCLKYLMNINFTYTMFPIFGMVYGGVTQVIVSIFGLWAVNTIHKDVVKVFYLYLVPIVSLVLLGISAICFDAIAGSNEKVADFYDGVDDYNGRGIDENRIKLFVQAQLLIAGVLGIFACVMRFISAATGRSLYLAMERMESDYQDGLQSTYDIAQLANLESASVREGLIENLKEQKEVRRQLKLTKGDVYVIAWAVVMGLFDLYVFGTFAIFANSAAQNSDKGSSGYQWLYNVWDFLGSYDSRFIDRDGYVVTASSIIAIFIGPLLFLFAWATYVKAPYRHMIGVLATSIHVFSQIVYYCIEFTIDFADIHVGRGSTLVGFVFLLIASLIIGLLLPFIVLLREMRESSMSVVQSDMQAILLQGIFFDEEDDTDGDMSLERLERGQKRSEDADYLLRVLSSSGMRSKGPEGRIHVGSIESADVSLGQYYRIQDEIQYENPDTEDGQQRDASEDEASAYSKKGLTFDVSEDATVRSAPLPSTQRAAKKGPFVRRRHKTAGETEINTGTSKKQKLKPSHSLPDIKHGSHSLRVKSSSDHSLATMNSGSEYHSGSSMKTTSGEERYSEKMSERKSDVRMSERTSELSPKDMLLERSGDEVGEAVERGGNGDDRDESEFGDTFEVRDLPPSAHFSPGGSSHGPSTPMTNLPPRSGGSVLGSGGDSRVVNVLEQLQAARTRSRSTSGVSSMAMSV